MVNLTVFPDPRELFPIPQTNGIKVTEKGKCVFVPAFLHYALYGYRALDGTLSGIRIAALSFRFSKTPDFHDLLRSSFYKKI